MTDEHKLEAHAKLARRLLQKFGFYQKNGAIMMCLTIAADDDLFGKLCAAQHECEYDRMISRLGQEVGPVMTGE